MYFKGNSLQSPIKQNPNYIQVLKRKLWNSAKKIVLVKGKWRVSWYTLSCTKIVSTNWNTVQLI